MINKKILVPLLIFFLLFSVIALGTPNFVDIGTTTEFKGDAGVPADSAWYIGEYRLDLRVITEWTFTHMEDQLFFGEPGDMFKLTYDSDEDGDIDVSAGGTEKSTWTLYAIPYLSGTTTFGEILIGTEGQVLKVGAGATGYEFANESDPTVDSDAEIKAILVDEVTKTGDFTANRLPEINNSSGIIEQSDIEHKTNGGYDFNANSAGFTTQTAVGDGNTTLDWRIGPKFRFVFGAQNETFTFTNPGFSCHLQIILIQDGVGSREATWPAGIYWATGTIPTLSTAGNARDIVNFFFDDNDDIWYGMGTDFAIP